MKCAVEGPATAIGAKDRTCSETKQRWLFDRTLIVTTICKLLIKFDHAKNDENIKTRGLSFERAADFGFDNSFVSQDIRVDYPEVRFVALGMLDQRLHVLCFTPIEGGIRVISFRKANAREIKRYEQNLD